MKHQEAFPTATVRVRYTGLVQLKVGCYEEALAFPGTGINLGDILDRVAELHGAEIVQKLGKGYAVLIESAGGARSLKTEDRGACVSDGDTVVFVSWFAGG